MTRWPTKPLGAVCTINPKLAGSDAPGANTEVTFVPMSAVDEVSGTIPRPEHRRYSEVAKGYTPFCENDVLFAKITPCMQNGKAAVASNLCNGFGFGSTEFHVLRSTGSVLPRWVFAFIRQPAFRSAAEASFTGSAGQQRVPADFLKTFPIPVPPLAEQERIVKLLDEADELRRLRAQADRRAADLIPAIFNEMFGSKQQSKAGWILKPLGELTTRVTKGESPGWQGFEYTEKGSLFVTSQNVLWGELELSEQKYIPMEFHKKLSRSAIQPNDVLFNLVGASIGRACIFPPDKGDANVNQAVAVISCGEGIMPEFLLHLLLSDDAQSIFHGGKVEAARANISLSDIRQFKLVLPPLALQKEFTNRVSEIRAMQAEQAASRRRLDDLFQSMLHRAFQGEL